MSHFDFFCVQLSSRSSDERPNARRVNSANAVLLFGNKPRKSENARSGKTLFGFNVCQKTSNNNECNSYLESQGCS